MKMIVKLAVLFATLLLLTGVSFAISCDLEECYEVKTTDLDNPTVDIPKFFAKICLNYEYKTGNASICNEDPAALFLFFGPLGMQVLAYDKDCVQSFKFHGSDNNVLTGIGYCEGVRFTTWGHKTDGENCSSPACIHIEKLTNGQDADNSPGPNILVGSNVTWTYVVTNTGAVPLTNVIVTDNQGVAVSCPKTTLAPGESMTCVASGTAIAGQYANIGTVIADWGSGSVTASDPSHYYGEND